MFKSVSGVFFFMIFSLLIPSCFAMDVSMGMEESPSFQNKIDEAIAFVKTAKTGRIDTEQVKKDMLALVDEALNLKEKAQFSVDEEDILINKVLLKIAALKNLRQFAFQQISKFEGGLLSAEQKGEIKEVVKVEIKGAYPDPDLNKKGLEAFNLFVDSLANDKILDSKEIDDLIEKLIYLEENELLAFKRDSLSNVVGFVLTAPPMISKANDGQKNKLKRFSGAFKKPVGFQKRIQFLYSKVDPVAQMSKESQNRYFMDLKKLCWEFSEAKAKPGPKPQGEDLMIKLFSYIELKPEFFGRANEIKDLKEKFGKPATGEVMAKPEVKPEEPKVEPKKEEPKPAVAPVVVQPIPVPAPGRGGRGPAVGGRGSSPASVTPASRGTVVRGGGARGAAPGRGR